MNDRWTWRPLGELFEIGAGKTMSAAARNGPDKTPFLRTSNVLWDEIDLSSVDEMSIPEHELPAKLLRPGDLLVCEGGEIGRAAIWNGEVETMSFQNHLHRLRPIVEDVEPRFYVYFLQSAFTQLGIFEGAGNKTTIPNLSRSRLAALEVPHPPLDDQQAISAALGRVRDAMRIQSRKRGVLNDLFSALLHQLMTREIGVAAVDFSTVGDIVGKPRFQARQPRLMDFVGRFEAKSSPTHINDALAAIDRMKDDGAKFWDEGSDQLTRWRKSCTTLWTFLNTLGNRRDIEKQDLTVVLREFIQEFEHSTWRMYQMLYGTLDDPDSDPTLRQKLDWFDFVYKLSTYAVVSTWIDDKTDQVSARIMASLTSRERTEKWARNKMRIPKNYHHASKNL